jgi:hypothetical protein
MACKKMTRLSSWFEFLARSLAEPDNRQLSYWEELDCITVSAPSTRVSFG